MVAVTKEIRALLEECEAMAKKNGYKALAAKIRKVLDKRPATSRPSSPER